jgi:hypothetical protein
VVKKDMDLEVNCLKYDLWNTLSEKESDIEGGKQCNSMDCKE